LANKLVEDGVADIQAVEDLFDRYIAEDIVNPETGDLPKPATPGCRDATL
jgi:hypothetical protein